MTSLELDQQFMRQAIRLAQEAESKGEVPVGALIVHEGQVIAEAYNYKESKPCSTAHAEMLAIEKASEHLGRWRLTGCTLYVTLEPCLMCAGGLVQARVDRVVYGTKDPKAGAVDSVYQILNDSRLNHQPEVASGVLEKECSEQLRKFFRRRREEKKQQS